MKHTLCLTFNITSVGITAIVTEPEDLTSTDFTVENEPLKRKELTEKIADEIEDWLSCWMLDEFDDTEE